MATLPGAWSFRVSAGTGLPSVSVVRLGEVRDLICSFYVSLAPGRLVWADWSLRYTTALPTCPYLPVLVWKLAGSTDVHPYFSKYGQRVCRKYRNRDMNECEFVASEADRRPLMGSYHSLTFAYFKPYPGLKYTAGPDWSKKFVKPVSIDLALKLYGSLPSSDMAGLKLSAISGCMKLTKRRKNARNQGNKFGPDKNPVKIVKIRT